MRPIEELMRTIMEATEPSILERPEFQNTPTLSEHLAHLMKQKGITQAELGRALLLERTYAYQLFTGIRALTRRQLLCIALVLKLTVEETQCLLQIAQRGELYPRRHFDALMLYAIKSGFDIDQACELLVSAGEKSLL